MLRFCEEEKERKDFGNKDRRNKEQGFLDHGRRSNDKKGARNENCLLLFSSLLLLSLI